MKRGIDKVNQHTAEVHRKEPQHGITSAVTAKRGRWVTQKRKSEQRDRTMKKTACRKHAHKPNHINTDLRKEGAECCKTNPYWKSSLVLRVKGQCGHSVHVCASVYLAGRGHWRAQGLQSRKEGNSTLLKGRERKRLLLVCAYKVLSFYLYCAAAETVTPLGVNTHPYGSVCAHRFEVTTCQLSSTRKVASERYLYLYQLPQNIISICNQGKKGHKIQIHSHSLSGLLIALADITS